MHRDRLGTAQTGGGDRAVTAERRIEVGVRRGGDAVDEDVADVGAGDRADAVDDGAGLVRCRRLGGDAHVVGEPVRQLLGEVERPVEWGDLLAEVGQDQPVALQTDDGAADGVGGVVDNGGPVVVDDGQRRRVALADVGAAPRIRERQRDRLVGFVGQVVMDRQAHGAWCRVTVGEVDGGGRRRVVGVVGSSVGSAHRDAHCAGAATLTRHQDLRSRADRFGDPVGVGAELQLTGGRIGRRLAHRQRGRRRHPQHRLTLDRQPGGDPLSPTARPHLDEIGECRRRRELLVDAAVRDVHVGDDTSRERPCRPEPR